MFNAPSDIAYHSLTGFLFVADTGNHCIRCIRPDLMGVAAMQQAFQAILAVTMGHVLIHYSAFHRQLP